MMRRIIPVIIILSLSIALFPAHASPSYVPQQGDYFTYHEVTDLGSGTGSYQGYTEHADIDGTETIIGVLGSGNVTAHYGYTWNWSNSSGSRETQSPSGNFTFSYLTFQYLKGTDNQTGYSKPYVWFFMNNSSLVGENFYLLNTNMTVKSTDYSYRLNSQNRYVHAIFAEGISTYQRNDVYGVFSAAYTWDTYFDPLTGYIIGYSYTEQDTSPSAGFTYTETLYVSATSYALSTAPAPSNLTQYLIYIGAFFLIVIVIVIIAIAVSRSRRKLPRHAYPQVPVAPPQIDLTPKQQPPVQQIVVKEIVKVKCRYCGALIDSTVQACPFCGAPRT